MAEFCYRLEYPEEQVCIYWLNEEFDGIILLFIYLISFTKNGFFKNCENINMQNLFLMFINFIFKIFWIAKNNATLRAPLRHVIPSNIRLCFAFQKESAKFSPKKGLQPAKFPGSHAPRARVFTISVKCHFVVSCSRSSLSRCTYTHTNLRSLQPAWPRGRAENTTSFSATGRLFQLHFTARAFTIIIIIMPRT